MKGEKGRFYGIELDETNKGKNNGNGYFKCDKKKGVFVQKTDIKETSNKKKKKRVDITYGDKVKLKKKGCVGTVRFIGEAHFKSNTIFCGVELDEAKGKGNGNYPERWYFDCKDKHASFVAVNKAKIEKIDDTKREEKIKQKVN